MVVLQMVASCSPGTFCRNEYKGRRAFQCEIIWQDGGDLDSGGCGPSRGPSLALILLPGPLLFHILGAGEMGDLSYLLPLTQLPTQGFWLLN